MATLPTKSMLDRFHLEAGDEVSVIETSDGLLITPFDPEFAAAMAVYERGIHGGARLTRSEENVSRSW